jgi:hypothetical protein
MCRCLTNVTSTPKWDCWRICDWRRSPDCWDSGARLFYKVVISRFLTVKMIVETARQTTLFSRREKSCRVWPTEQLSRLLRSEVSKKNPRFKA